MIPESASVSTDAFALLVVDDSMVDRDKGSHQSLFPGDCAVLDPIDIGELPSVKPGAIVLADDGNGRKVLRKFGISVEGIAGPERITLTPLNPVYPSKDVPAAAVLAVMRGIYRKVL